MSDPGAARVTAVLGPTNTGKTHFAMERLLGHASGMIGFPLRLLARENYDRAVARKGAHAVALITGEEKIQPPFATHFICTVEAMPVDRPVAFAAVDEIQLAADPERGHVFTDRLLRLRGSEETIFIGAETVRPLLRRLVPEAEVVTRPRFSRLSYAGPKRITRLPSRTAVIGFSATEVYALAELMRRRRGGTAVVLGALSPRTRNAQVAMYQAGEVDYLVATDAIGMGLNMDIDHVAFAGLTKFDGRLKRHLTAAEVGQIAGRAGRHMSDGTFGTTAGQAALTAETVEAVESHTFPALKDVFWRNAELDFESLDSLIESLTAPPIEQWLVPAREAEDFRTLSALARAPEVRAAASSRPAVSLLWEVCQIPDFRKLMTDAHVRLAGRIYRDLTSPKARISPGWLEREVRRIDRVDGDIGALVGRIAEIRTWTYVSHRADWLDDAFGWQERTRAVEDRLSDTLHERLTERFVDRRTAVLVKRLRERGPLLGGIGEDGRVVVEGHDIGELKGFRFLPDPAAMKDDARAIRATVGQLLRPELEARAAALAAVEPRAIRLRADGTLGWQGAAIARLAPGEHPMQPGLVPLIWEEAEADIRTYVRRTIEAWLTAHVRRLFGPIAGRADPAWPAPLRGIVFQLAEGLGTVPRHQIAALVDGLDGAGRKKLAKLGIRLGRTHVYAPKLLHGEAADLRGRLVALHFGLSAEMPLARGRKLPPGLARDLAVPDAAYLARGYAPFKTKALRVDRLEALDVDLRRLSAQGPFTPIAALADAYGGSDMLREAVGALGYRWVGPGRDAGTAGHVAPRPKRKPGGKKAPRARPAGQRRDRGPNPCSPFAILRELTNGR